MFEYRFDILIFTLSNGIIPLVALAIWFNVSLSGNLADFRSGELVVYFLMVVWVTDALQVWGSYFLGEDINRGDFSKFLIKPFYATQYYLIWNLSEKFYKMSFVSVAIFLLGWGILGDVSWLSSFGGANILLFIAALVIGFGVAFLLDMVVGLVTFWTHDIDFFRHFLLLLEIVFSGRIIPYAFFPENYREILIFLPFRYVVSFPIEVLMGKIDFWGMMVGLGIGSFWFLCFYIIYKRLNVSGLRIYQGYGA